MNQNYEIFKGELIHLYKSPFKIFSIIIFIVAIVYGCYNGYNLFVSHTTEIESIMAENNESILKNIQIYDDIEQGNIDKPRRDPSSPYWAIWNVPSSVFKYPFPMMVFSLGQSEQYGYHKKVSNWSTTFDGDLIEEIANPERLAIGTLDFNFVLLYLTPMLIIILLFNVGGLEKDLNFENFILLNNISKRKWLLLRYSFYFLAVNTLVFISTIPYILLSGLLQTSFIKFAEFSIIILVYSLIWFILFYFINLYSSGSSDTSLKMISVWLLLCIIIPGAVHQISAFKFPNKYMVDYLDTSREKTYAIFDLPFDSLKLNLLEEFPNLNSTVYATDTTLNERVINRSISGLANILNKKVAKEIEARNEERNQFIRTLFFLNPIIFFQNRINELAETDYYSYKNFRKEIQITIDKKITLILKSIWNKERIDKEKYVQYTKLFN